MKLYIAEKPSLARAIADVLPKPHQRGEGFIRVGNGDCVSWCIGHLLEQLEPESYDPAYKQWKSEHLPIIPQQWQLQPKPKTRKQLSVLRKLVKEAESIIHAGDPDREGQLLVDQVLDFLGVKGAKKDAVQRCLISDLNPSAVKRAVAQLRANSEFIPLSVSALARSRADWLYGINMTRAYTLQGRKVGFDGLLSVGRVQTPVLGMVVRRDKEIENFVSKPFFQVLAHLKTQTGETFTAKWQPSEACLPYMDEEGRVIHKALAENVVARITDKPAKVSELKQQKKKQPPPLPYSLSSLQIDAAKRFGMNAKQVLDVCQALYERHKLITYPRSDSRYLPVEHFKMAPAVVDAIRLNSRTLQKVAEGAKPSIKGRAWNDTKVDAHHAIIPTSKKTDVSKLSSQERQLYEHIARQYLSQFYSHWEYHDTCLEVIVEGGLFVAKARTTLQPGWKLLFEKVGSEKAGMKGHRGEANEKGSHNDQASAEHTLAFLPTLHKGDELTCLFGELQEKHTQAPKYFTDATLLAAMTGISRFVTDPDIRKILKDTDGLGTEATRAGILDLLFKRHFLLRNGRQIRSTPTAKALVDSLPLSATTPDMTARWESVLGAISQRKNSYAEFMEPLTATLEGLILQSQTVLPMGLKGLPSTKPAYRRRKRTVKKPRACT